MNKVVVLLTALTVSGYTPLAMAEIINWKDGLSHTINDNTYENDHIRVDRFITHNPGTHVTFEGGTVGQLDSHRNATITMTGGVVTGELEASGSSTITMTGGTVKDDFIASGYSTVTMLGGSLESNFQAKYNGTVIMTGGTVAGTVSAVDNANFTLSGGSIGNLLGAGQNGTTYLDGTGFKVDGQTLSYGDKLSDFVPLFEYRLEGNIFDYYTGTITGTLADGTALNNEFKIYNTGNFAGTADIIIIPEPCSLVLLSLGGLMLRKKFRR